MTMRAHWWALAHEDDVPAGKPVPVQIGELAIVLFRDGQGVVRALEDRCAHRRAPLSLGHVTPEGFVQCPYHGWRYEGETGKCRAIPNFSADEKVPGNFGVRAFATRSIDGLVFVWAGRPSEAGDGPAARTGLDTTSLVRGTAALPCPHAMYAALILDRPGAVLAIDGVRLLDDFRWGDPRVANGEVIGEFGAMWSGKALSRLPSTPPLSLTVAVGAGTAAARIALIDAEGKVLAGAYIAAAPQGDLVTRLCHAGWAADRPRGRPPAIRLRTALDVAAVARTRRAALPDWQQLSAA